LRAPPFTAPNAPAINVALGGDLVTIPRQGGRRANGAMRLWGARKGTPRTGGGVDDKPDTCDCASCS
jgi:hypothetical protein